jgi:hypothetical protein
MEMSQRHTCIAILNKQKCPLFKNRTGRANRSCLGAGYQGKEGGSKERV